MRTELADLTSALISKPGGLILAMILKATRIVLSDDVPTAFTNGRYIAVNPEFFGKLDRRFRLAVLAHEALHVARQDPVRLANYIRVRLGDNPDDESFKLVELLYDFIADAKVNTTLKEELRIEIPAFFITCKDVWEKLKIGSDDCKEKSVEELIDEILSGGAAGGLSGVSSESVPHGMRDIRPGAQTDTDAIGGTVINEGDPELVNAEEEEARRKIIQILFTAAVMGGARKMPGWAARIIDELTETKTDWKRLLMKYLRTGYKVRMKLTIPNRKIEDLPGKMLYGMSDVVVLIDTSGSISNEELGRFVSEVRAMTPAAKKIVVIPFDATAYPEVVIRSKNDIKKLVLNLKGGGGTVIGPALEVVEKKYRNTDAVVILSDWDIADLRSTAVERAMRRLADKIIAVTTKSEPPSYIKKRIRIEVPAKHF